jgi:hypothetical protein
VIFNNQKVLPRCLWRNANEESEVIVKMYWTLVVGVCLAVSGWAAYGQQTTGEITGTVTDSTGAVIPDASVKITNTGTQEARTTLSNSTGNYTAPYLTPGTYTVDASKAGFKSDVASGLDVTVGAVVKVDFKLEVGQVTQQVEVTTAAPLISTESAALQNNVESQQILALPLNGRDFLSLVALMPNVENEDAEGANASLMGGVRGMEAISVSGQRLEFNHYTLDGIENTDPNFNTYIVHPSVDALQEFTVLTGVYSAEFGRGASQINATTLGGTNTYHGSAYDFMRNDFVDAKIWGQAGAKNPFHRQDYGFVLGGPLSIPRFFNAKNKLFFESSFEDYGDHEKVQEFASVPTQDMRNGIFDDFGVPAPGTGPTNGQIGQLYFPGSQVYGAGATACPVSSGGSYNTTTGVCTVSGTNNVIPSSMMSPIAKTILSYEPLPNQFGGANEELGYGDDYIAEQPSAVEYTQFNQRIDWTQNSRSSSFGRFSWESDLDVPATVFGNITSQTTNTLVRQTVLGNTFVITPHIVNEARFGWNQFNNGLANPYSGGSFDPQAALGIAGLVAYGPIDYGFPGISWTDLTGYGAGGTGGSSLYVYWDDLFQWLDSVSIIKGKHSITVGGMVERDRYNEFGNSFANGEFSFNNDSTENPKYGIVDTGFGLADMEFGYVSGTWLRVAALSNVQLRRSDYGAFAEDDWKLKHSLTLNLGIRYDNDRPWVEKHDNFENAQVFTTGVTISSAPRYVEPAATLVPGAESPILTRPGAAGCNFYAGANIEYAEPGQPVQCGDKYMGRATQNPDNKDFGPRIGLDWALGAKTSIRAGFGIFYAIDTGDYEFDLGRNQAGQDGVQTGADAATSLTPLASPWSAEAANNACGPNQYNGGVNWTGLCSAGAEFRAAYQFNRLPYIEQYMLHVERQLTKNVAVDVGYEGNESHHLDTYYTFNQSVPKVSATDTSSDAQRRPWPALGPFQTMRDWDSAHYSAGDVKLTQRLSHGLLYIIAFTWSRSLDYGSAIRPEAGGHQWPINSYNLRAEYGPSTFNLPRRFVASFVYNLPFGAGAEFVPSNAIVNHIVSGWTVGGILTVADGTSEEATLLSDTSGLGVNNNQPEYVGLGPYRQAHPKAWAVGGYWNPAAWVGAYTSPLLTWQTGNMSPGNLYTPGSQDFDSNIARTFHLWESHTLEFRFEAFNTLNRANWSSPTTNTTSANFGKITTTSQPMRELQGALKYSF